jgi:predicted nucleic acid-binding protein
MAWHAFVRDIAHTDEHPRVIKALPASAQTQGCAFFQQEVKSDVGLYLSVVTVGELRRGVELVRHRGDERHAAMLDTWLGAVLSDFAQRILPVDEDVGQLWGRLRVPHPEHALEKLIAATALIHDLTVVTRNVDDFVGLGVRALNPFE